MRAYFACLRLVAARTAILPVLSIGFTGASADPVLEPPRYIARYDKSSSGYCPASPGIERAFSFTPLGACVAYFDAIGGSPEFWSSISIQAEGDQGNCCGDPPPYIEGPVCVAEAPSTSPTRPTDRFVFALCPPRTIELDKNFGLTCPALPSTESGSVNPASGNLFQVETDYEGAGPFPLDLRRTFNSLSGRGWRHNYENAIRYRAGTSEVYVYRPDGKVLTFQAPLDQSGQPLLQGRLASEPDVDSTLDVLSDSTGTMTGFRYRTEYDRIETYDVEGRLIAVRNAKGRLQSLSYDAQGRLGEVRDEFGRSLTFSYDSEGRLATVLTPDGPLSYVYDSNSRLISVAYPDATPGDSDDNPRRYYHYEDARFSGHLTGITDENGQRHATWTYDLEGRVALAEKAGGADRIALIYNADGTSTVRDALGTERTYSFDLTSGVFRPLETLGGPCTDCAGQAQGYTYDPSGYIATKTDWNGVTTAYEHNERGLETRRTEAVGTPEERVITTEWHADFRLPIRITEPGRETTYTYDAAGRMLTRTVTDTLTAEARTWTHTYDALGLLTSVDGPRTDVSDVTRYEYDGQGNLIRSTNALGQITEITAYDGSGRPLTLVDPNGLVTALAYDSRGRLVSLTIGTGPEAQATTFDYDAVGNLRRITLSDNSFLDYTYDAAYRMTAMADSAGNRIEYTIDAMGNRTAENVYDRDGTLRRTRAMLYDNLSRLIQSIGGDNQVTDYAYDANGNRVSVNDALNRSTLSAFDTLDRLTTVTDPANGQTRYGYDALDNLTSVVDPKLNATRYTHNAFGDRMQQVSPDTGTTTFTHDSGGNLLNRTDAEGQTVSLAYDALNRVTQISDFNGALTVLGYDQGPNSIGRLSAVTEGGTATAYAYDALGRMTSKEQTIDGQSRRVGYAYDATGRLSAITYPSGTVVALGYDAAGRAASIMRDGRLLASNIDYEPFGPVKTLTFGNGLTLVREHDLDGRLAGVRVGTNQLAWALSYDTVNNVTNITDLLDPDLYQSYGYDSLDRLISVSAQHSAQSQISATGGQPLFSDAPALLTQIQTMTNETASVPGAPSTPWLTTAVRDVTGTGAQIALERSEVASGNVSSAESVGYLALPGASTGSFLDLDGNLIDYSTQISGDVITGWGNGCTGLGLNGTFADAPLVIASKTSHDGGNGGWLRRCSLSASAVGLTVDEDRYRDNERRHTTEQAAIVAFSRPFAAALADFDGGTWLIEAGAVTLNDTRVNPTATQVSFQHSYTVPPVVFMLASNQGGNPAAVRIRIVSTTGFEAMQVEPSGDDGPHVSMTVHYLVVEPGLHRLPDGGWIEAGTLDIAAIQHGLDVPGAESWDSLTFGTQPIAPPSAPATLAQAFEYDPNGNRVRLTQDGVITDYSLDLSSNRLLASTIRSYTHDANGNTLSDGRRNFEYDALNRLIGIDGAVSYGYNVLNQRISKRVGAETTFFVYDEQGHLLGEYDAAGTPLREYVWLDDMPLAQIEADGTIHYLHTDHLDTPRAASDETGLIVWRWDSDPFGAASPEEDPDRDGRPVTVNLRFPGQYYDAESGLHYNWHRYYDPETGRYITSDPIGLAGGINTYGYTENNPIRYADPLGLFTCITGIGCVRGDILRYEFNFTKKVIAATGKVAGCTAVCTVEDSILSIVLESLAERQLEKIARDAASSAAREGAKTAIRFIKLAGLLGLANTVATCEMTCIDKVCNESTR